MNLPIQLPHSEGERDGFALHVLGATSRPLVARAIDTVQVNIGLACDLACRHCHVESSPKRTEQMDWPTMQLVLGAARRANARTIDITGGAPELHPRLREFITAARGDGRDVIVRTNLTILLEHSYDDFPAFYATNRVHLIASLPCYLETNVDRQRGVHVYEKSVEAMRRLNAVGYGIDPALPLDLVYNPGGPALPPDQSELEADYRRELDARFGLRFTRLITITNMPIGRFLHDLRRDGRAEAYWALLRRSFNPATVDRLMCRSQIHVGWDGTLHDCDFNYALGMGIETGVDVSLHVAGHAGKRNGESGQESYSCSGRAEAGSSPPSERSRGLILDPSRQGKQPAAQAAISMSASRPHIRDFDPEALSRRPIATGPHCYGCTAGHGSSCGGALA